MKIMCNCGAIIPTFETKDTEIDMKYSSTEFPGFECPKCGLKFNLVVGFKTITSSKL